LHRLHCLRYAYCCPVCKAHVSLGATAVSLVVIVEEQVNVHLVQPRRIHRLRLVHPEQLNTWSQIRITSRQIVNMYAKMDIILMI
jgi:hypothetical protein